MLLLLFFLTPIAEMYLLIEVAGYIDTLPTIGLVMLTAVIGVFLLKRQGWATLTRGVERMNRGEVPAREMAEGILLAVAGALLITPGFITDTIGFTLLFPPSRALIAQWLLSRVQMRGVEMPGRVDPTGQRPESGPTVIEGEFTKRP